MAATKIDHTHALFIHPSDTTGGPIIPIQLIGSENYSIWSRSMRIQLLGKNKLGIVDGTWKKEDFPSDLAHQWDRCDAISNKRTTCRDCICRKCKDDLGRS